MPGLNEYSGVYCTTDSGVYCTTRSGVYCTIKNEKKGRGGTPFIEDILSYIVQLLLSPGIYLKHD